MNQEQIKNINQALDNNNKQLEKLGTKQDDLKDYDKIKISLASFKTKLNAKVAPRISDIASSMYSQITKGKYQHIEVSNDFDFLLKLIEQTIKNNARHLTCIIY